MQKTKTKTMRGSLKSSAEYHEQMQPGANIQYIMHQVSRV